MGDNHVQISRHRFLNVLVISSREPMSDDVDRQDETLDANLGAIFFSRARELEKAVFGAA